MIVYYHIWRFAAEMCASAELNSSCFQPGPEPSERDKRLQNWFCCVSISLFLILLIRLPELCLWSGGKEWSGQLGHGPCLAAPAHDASREALKWPVGGFERSMAAYTCPVWARWKANVSHGSGIRSWYRWISVGRTQCVRCWTFNYKQTHTSLYICISLSLYIYIYTHISCGSCDGADQPAHAEANVGACVCMRTDSGTGQEWHFSNRWHRRYGQKLNTGVLLMSST